MNDASFEAEQNLIRSAIILVLFNCIGNVLLGKLVFQLHGDYWQTVDEDTDIQCQTRVEAGIL